MKKILFVLSLLAGIYVTYAQEESTDEPKEGWTTAGNISLLFNQSAFNAEWLGGGTSNIAGNLAVSYDFNYLKDDWTWDNKILVDYGLTKVKDDDFTKKTNDRLEFNSLLGKKASGNWYYSAFMNFKTQIAKGYAYGEDEFGNEIRTEITHFFSPAYLQFGPGMLWKKSDNLKVNIAPATARLIFVDKDFTLPDDAYFGVEEGKSSRFEFGASLSAYAKFDVMTNVSMENILNLYSNYLEDPQNVDIDYTMNLVMKINKYLSTNLTFQAIYDDNAIAAFQIREMFGLGINYGF
ncbi:DUF3078 domain-containing protein [Abyssalbus ytuae]|uniref:DUF3078 domain-containing protein n=1 Tax=Abyssalbus ytuae TaxID=2926907 RepID=A0A9E7CXT7_9FLAO|nr:DUF3078 domain-containing protein [Abyssalbus ytuae]UOB15925.1 DUF3078 domain-containing protein [Abyssalbus ytuae]